MGLQGSIDSFPLEDVLRLLASTGKSGRLAVDGDRGEGHLWLDAGRLVGGGTALVGIAGDPPGLDEVVVDLLRNRTGTFGFEADASGANPIAAVEVESVLATAAVLLDELEALSCRVPSLGHQVVLRPSLEADEVTLDRQRWSAVVAVSVGCSVDELGRSTGLGEVAVLRTVCDLLDLGIVELLEPAAEVEPTFEVEPTLEVGPLLDPEPAFEVAFDPFEPALEPAPTPSPEPVVPPEPALADHTEAGPDEHLGDGPGDDLEVPEGLEELFGDFDPFGSASQAADLEVDPGADSTAGTAEGAGGASDADVDAGVVPALAALVGITDGLRPAVDAEDPDAELARQMAMLSPKAAQAVAAVAGSTDDASRDHLVRFLGSV